MKTFFTSITTFLLLAAPLWSAPIANLSNQSSPVLSVKFYETGLTAFTQGRFAEASSQWQQAITIYRQQGNQLGETITLANLALAYRELGQWQEANNTITTSLNLAKSLQPLTPDVQRAIAQALDTQGSLAFAQGKSEAALQAWREAQTLHQQLQDSTASIRNTINQARAYQRLGLFIRSRQEIAIASESVIKQPDSLQKVELLHHIGNILLVIAEPAKAEPYLLQSQQILAKLGDSPISNTLKSRILVDMGHLTRAKAEDENLQIEDESAFDTALNTARGFYADAETTAVNPLDRTNAQLNLAKLLIATKKTTELNLLLTKMQSSIDILPLSRQSIENRIRYAEILGNQGQRQKAARLLAQSMVQAKTLNDNRTYIYALGTLGHLYEQNQQFSNAIDLTNQAISLSQANNADDLAYQWHWQMARLLKATGKNEAALISYAQAVKVLNLIQGDLASAPASAQFYFQESIEPLYREYVSLLLATSGFNDQQKLKQAQSVIESLKVAELVNFFRSDCVKTQSNDISSIDQTAAIVYVIALSDRLEMLLTLPNGNIKRYTSAITASKVDANVEDLQEFLRDSTSKEYLKPAQSIYDWTIRPLEADLVSNKVQTIVIVSDQSLRNIPFAVLHDGNQFLVEKYNLTSSPGLQLLDSKAIAKKQFNVQLAGLSQSRFGFSALPGVQQEVDAIQKKIGNDNTNLLLNETFTSQSLQNAIQTLPFPVLHIATHGQFSSQAAETFIVAWDRKINIDEFNTILRSRQANNGEPLELLILSACETAIGDKRSTLGLAGIAIRAGARSTIGSLWQINDEATSILMSALYDKLSDPNVTRAEALRSAQLTLLKNPKFSHPDNWSPFILLGNWQ